MSAGRPPSLPGVPPQNGAAPTRLGALQSQAAPTSAAAANRGATGQQSKLGAFLATGASREVVELPGLGPAWVVLAGHAAVQRIEGEVYRAMEALGVPLNAVTATTYEAERAVRTLAESVRDPTDVNKPFGTLAEWGALDIDRLSAIWTIYGDVRERLDPMSEVLTDEVRAGIADAVAKKNSTLLRTFGVTKLAAWLATTDAPPST